MHGKKPWNFGLKKETDERVKKYGEIRILNSLNNNKHKPTINEK